jgi:beta-1,4-mannosyl-glycoprotein beta-1,4-N-acetylglucosaminyltransferase
MIIDVFHFFNEVELLEYRLEYMYPQVDKFVIVEGDITHAGHPKPKNFSEERFAKYMDKIVYKLAKLPLTKEECDAYGRTKGSSKWGDPALRDYAQREAAQDVLKEMNLDDKDIIIFSDLDEIPNMTNVLKKFKPGCVNYLRQHLFFQCYHYYNADRWDKAFAAEYGLLKHHHADVVRLGEQRQTTNVVIEDAGWHFSYFGGAKRMQTKLSNFCHQEERVQRHNDLKNLEDSLRSHVIFNSHVKPSILLDDDMSNFPAAFTLPPNIDYLKKHFASCKEV